MVSKELMESISFFGIEISKLAARTKGSSKKKSVDQTGQFSTSAENWTL